MKTKTLLTTAAACLASVALPLLAQESATSAATPGASAGGTAKAATDHSKMNLQEMMKDKGMMRQMCAEMCKDPEMVRMMCQEMMKNEQAMKTMCEEIMKNPKAKAMCMEMMK